MNELRNEIKNIVSKYSQQYISKALADAEYYEIVLEDLNDYPKMLDELEDLGRWIGVEHQMIGKTLYIQVMNAVDSAYDYSELMNNPYFAFRRNEDFLKFHFELDTLGVMMWLYTHEQQSFCLTAYYEFLTEQLTPEIKQKINQFAEARKIVVIWFEENTITSIRLTI